MRLRLICISVVLDLQRVCFEPDGNLPPPPAKLVNNPESWIEFTDLVFVDPVGTGLSRVIEQDKTDTEKPDPAKTVDEKEFYAIKRDLESLGEFIERFLSKHKLWHLPVYIAGESYGGFRTAKLARRLQENHGIGLTAAIAISPALEFSLLNENDYDVLRYMDTFCSMALAAAFHGRSRVFKKGEARRKHAQKKLRNFATGELAPTLVGGRASDGFIRSRPYGRLFGCFHRSSSAAAAGACRFGALPANCCAISAASWDFTMRRSLP